MNWTVENKTENINKNPWLLIINKNSAHNSFVVDNNIKPIKGYGQSSFFFEIFAEPFGLVKNAFNTKYCISKITEQIEKLEIMWGESWK